MAKSLLALAVETRVAETVEIAPISGSLTKDSLRPSLDTCSKRPTVHEKEVISGFFPLLLN